MSKERPAHRKYIREFEQDDNEEPFVVHPDIGYATRHYDGTDRSFKTAMEIRQEMLEKKTGKYWVDTHDEELAETAKERTDNARCRGWKYPKVKRRGK